MGGFCLGWSQPWSGGRLFRSFRHRAFAPRASALNQKADQPPFDRQPWCGRSRGSPCHRPSHLVRTRKLDHVHWHSPHCRFYRLLLFVRPLSWGVQEAVVGGKMTTVQGCPFCPENGKVVIIAQDERGYLVQAIGRQGVVMPGCYLIIPKEHAESLLGLPEEWQAAVNYLLSCVPGMTRESQFNLSYNLGHDAGQRVGHIHAWVIFRGSEESPPSHGLGLAALIAAANNSASRPVGS